jgi:hypothetical protein
MHAKTYVAKEKTVSPGIRYIQISSQFWLVMQQVTLNSKPMPAIWEANPNAWVAGTIVQNSFVLNYVPAVT